MNTLGNLIWLIFGGLVTAVEYVILGLGLCLTIIGIPFGLQCFKLAVLTLLPFGKDVRNVPQPSGCITTFFNILWFFTGGIILGLTHLFFGVLLFITIIGIPFAKQHFKLMALSITPFGKEIVDKA